MTNKSPAYQWYPKDILASSRVGEMTAEEECWYRRALDYCWINESIPADAERLARLIGKGATKGGVRVVLQMFVPSASDPARLVSQRQELEREKQREWREKSAAGGRASAGKRKTIQALGDEQGGSTTVATKEQPNEQQTGNQKATLLSPVSVKKKEDRRPRKKSDPSKLKTRPDLDKDAFLSHLADKPEYEHVAVVGVFHELIKYCKDNNQKPTRLRLLKWLDKRVEEVPFTETNLQLSPEDIPPPTESQEELAAQFAKQHYSDRPYLQIG